MNPMMYGSLKIVVDCIEMLQAYGGRGGMHIGPSQLPRCQILHSVHGRL